MSKFPYKIDKDSRVKATSGGYYYVTTTPNYDGPGGNKMSDHDKTYVYEHKIKMENHLGRFLSKDEQINHLSGDKSDNRLSNLELTTLGIHQREHSKKDNPFWEDSPLYKKRKKSYQTISGNLRQIAGLLIASTLTKDEVNGVLESFKNFIKNKENFSGDNRLTFSDTGMKALKKISIIFDSSTDNFIKAIDKLLVVIKTSIPANPGMENIYKYIESKKSILNSISSFEEGLKKVNRFLEMIIHTAIFANQK